MGTSLFEQFEKEQGDSLYQEFLKEQQAKSGPRALSRIPGVQPDATRALARNRPNPTGDFESAYAGADDLAGKALAFEANLAQGIPGMEALQAGTRALVRRQPYQEALADLRGSTESLPASVRLAGQMVGSAPLAGLMPVGPTRTVWQGLKEGAKLGARFGAADAAADADPKSLADRALETGLGTVAGGTIGGITGGVVKTGSRGRRLNRLRQDVNQAETAGANAESRRAAFKASDAEKYGAVEAEAAARGGSSTRTRALAEDPMFKEHFDDIASDYAFQGKPTDDATILLQMRRELSSKESPLVKKIVGAKPGDAISLSVRQRGNIQAMKDRIDEALGMAGEKPPITMDVAPEVFDVEPAVVNPGREAMRGPVLEGTAGRMRGDASQVALDASGRATSVSPRDVQGPAGPAFQLGAQAEKVTPGVRIETPAMRVQTAPAEAEAALAPSIADAAASSADLRGDLSAFQKFLGHGRRIASGQTTPPDKLTTESPEAVSRLIREIAEKNPERLPDVLEALRVAGKEGLRLPTWRPDQTAWGSAMSLTGPARRLERLEPFLNQTRTALGQPPVTGEGLDLQTLLRLMGLANAPLANR